jgi:hypothetical protein
MDCEVTDSESNSLRRELAALAPTGDHPDADVLTAFAEGSLLERERHSVLGHLARCAECREVLSLSAVDLPQPAPELELVAAAAPFVVNRSPRPKLYAWLPWAAVAAGIVGACGVALHYEELRLAQGRLVARQQATAPVASPAVEPYPAPAPSREVEPRKPAHSATPQPQHAPPEKQLATEPDAVREKANAAQFRMPESPIRGKAISNQPPTAAAEQSTNLSAPTPLQNASAFTNRVTENSLASTPAATIARAHWRINDQGQPERSFGDGVWQPVLPGEKYRMRVLSVSNGEVWVGGEDERVYRSRDEGVTWQPVTLPAKGGSSHTIVHIGFESPLAGTIEAADGTIWTTDDGGNTWN